MADARQGQPTGIVPSLESLRSLLRRPILEIWLRESRVALVALALHILFMTQLLAPLVRTVAPAPRPRSFIERFQAPPDPYPRVKGWLAPLLWIAGLSGVGWLAARRIRPALQRARRESQALEAEAISAAGAGEVVSSVLLLERAEAMEPDPARRSSIRQKRDELEGQATRAARDAAPSPLARTALATAAVESLGPGGRIRLVKQLGKGAMGVVFLGEDTLLGRRVAVKQLPSSLAHDPEMRDRFTREARSLARLSSPNVVQVYDLHEQAGNLFLSLEFCEGPDLASMLKTAGRLPPAQVVRVAMGIANGLLDAHQKGIVHRDLKPANVLSTAGGTLKVADFGLARLAGSALTQAGTVMGTPFYMAPEQALGKTVDERADLYALGCVLFELATGRPPYLGTIAEILAQHTSSAPPPSLRAYLPEAPEGLSALVGWLMSKDPAARPPSAREVLNALALV